jgi:uncharacterized protein (DUF1501 family)
MNRRRFLQVAGLAGLAVMAPFATRDGRASSTKYKGPFWIMVNAGGGWDPTMLCDPKGGTDPEDAKQVNHSYAPGDKGKAGNIEFAPTTWAQNDVTLMTAADFFGAHYKRLLVLNGVDTSTNNHDAGVRTTWSGQLPEGYPAFAALAAAIVSQAQPVPLAFLSNGGYDATAGVVSLTRIGGTDALQRLAFTNDINPGDANLRRYHTQTTAARIAAAQEARLRTAQAKQRLPAIASAMGSLYLARQSDVGLASLGEALNATPLVNFPDDFPEVAGIGGIGELEGLLRQAQIALLSFQSGVAVSANLAMGGFDTHDDSDDRQSRQMMILCFMLDYLFKQIDAMGLTDQVYVVVGSDFGRTPFYNSNRGKDHWNITSMLLAGPKIPGNKVIGSTDAAYAPVLLDPKTLQPSASGVRIEPKHVHLALRKLISMDASPYAHQFGLPGDPLPLFG